MVGKRLKLLRYEIQRILRSKVYLILGLITLVYSVYVLQSSILNGESGTAPFSEWSFLAYWLAVMPVLVIVILVYAAKTNDGEEQRVGKVTGATPTKKGEQLSAKAWGILIATTLVCILVTITAYVFYYMKFKIIAPMHLLLVMLLIIIPQIFFLLGVGLLAARLHVGAVYPIIGFFLFAHVTQLMLPMPIDFIGNSILSIPRGTYPIAGAIPFTIPTMYLIVRVAVLCVGVLLLVYACRGKSKIQA
ncbi:MAG: hypothetical protein ACOX3W_02385 [Christensenellaceae bacterium]|jgi:ABC-type multidrug transport system permease subunit